MTRARSSLRVLGISPRTRTFLGRSHRFRLAMVLLTLWLAAAIAASWVPASGGELGRTLLGARTAAVVASGVLGVAIPLGWSLGLLAGAGPRAADILLSRLVEFGGLWPTIVLLAVVQAAEPIPTLATFVLVVGLTRALRVARLVRGEALRVNHTAHVMAARALGLSRRRVLAWHVSPLTLGPTLVEGAFSAAVAIGLESALSFIGLGLPHGRASWGSQVVAASGTLEALMPAAAIAAVTGSLVLLADALDDASSPRRGHSPPGRKTETCLEQNPVTTRAPGTK